MLSEKLHIWLKEGESERLSFKSFFGHETIETLVGFANLHGGVLLVGITELKEIKGVNNIKENINHFLNKIHNLTSPRLFPIIEFIEIESKTVACVSIAEYPVKPVAYDGKYFKRTGKFNQELSVKEIIDSRRQSINSHWDFKLRTDKTIADISFKKLQQQIDRISRNNQCPLEEPLTFLRKYGLVEGEAITNACWLLFFPDEDPKTTIELRRFSSPTVVSDTLILKSDLFTEVEEAIRFICKHISIETQTNESVRWKYPVEAIRELVVNMIIHRDYTADYNSIIKIYDGYIEFYNPGSLPDDLSLQQLQTDGCISRTRNCLIAELFKDAGMFDEYGSGIRKICSAFADWDLRPPEFIKLPGRLIIRVYGDIKGREDNNRNKDNRNNIAGSFILQKNLREEIDDSSDKESHQQKNIKNFLSDREKQIIDFINKDCKIPLNKIALNLTVSKRTILRDIKKLKKEKILERIGNEKNGFWKINSNFYTKNGN